MAKGKQEEFGEMPERTPLGKKAIEYIKQKVVIEKAKDRLDVLGDELIDLFQKENKKKIVIEGNVVSLRNIIKNEIKVTKPSHQ